MYNKNSVFIGLDLLFYKHIKNYIINNIKFERKIIMSIFKAKDITRYVNRSTFPTFQDKVNFHTRDIIISQLKNCRNFNNSRIRKILSLL